MKLTDIVVKNLIKPGRYTDDQTKGLHLWVKDLAKKYWILRYTHEGTRYGLSLGVYPEVSLRLAREKALHARNELIKGVNPIVERVLSKKPKQANPVVLFSDFALDYIETMRPKWRNAKHGDQWVNTVTTFANPVIGQLPVAEIDTQHILAILQPIWLTKPETASRLRGRLQQILTAAVVRKLRPAFNPAAWDGHLAALLPSKRTSDKHHAALPFEVVPSFVALLRDMDSLSALALEFCILNACRTSEVLQARWFEIKDDVWIIPGTRMKAGKEHVAPLSRRSMEILLIARQRDHDSDYVFSRNGKPLSNMAMLNLTKRLNPTITVHGFRSTFRDWISEATELSPELAEMQLAHTIGNRVERAYRRGNLLEKRRSMMESWASHCNGTPMNRLLSVLKAA
jgi:integrase